MLRSTCMKSLRIYLIPHACIIVSCTRTQVYICTHTHTSIATITNNKWQNLIPSIIWQVFSVCTYLFYAYKAMCICKIMLLSAAIHIYRRHTHTYTSANVLWLCRWLAITLPRFMLPHFSRVCNITRQFLNGTCLPPNQQQFSCKFEWGGIE